MNDDDVELETPPAVIGSIAAGVGPLPFLAVYSVLFIAHGLIYPVQPPDIGNSQAGEAIAGFIAFALFVILVLAVWWFLNGRRRWLFAACQLATFVTSVDFVLDSTKGSPAVPLVLVLTSGTALVLAFLTPSWEHVGRRAPWAGEPAQPEQRAYSVHR